MKTLLLLATLGFLSGSEALATKIKIDSIELDESANKFFKTPASSSDSDKKGQLALKAAGRYIVENKLVFTIDGRNFPGVTSQASVPIHQEMELPEHEEGLLISASGADILDSSLTRSVHDKASYKIKLSDYRHNQGRIGYNIRIELEEIK